MLINYDADSNSITNALDDPGTEFKAKKRDSSTDGTKYERVRRTLWEAGHQVHPENLGVKPRHLKPQVK